MNSEEIREPLSREEIDLKFQRAGHKPENRNCDHQQYDFGKHGRYCPCGTVMADFGD